MKSNFRDGRLFKAIVLSVNINALMIVLGVVGNAVKPLSILARISNVIAAPTGFLLGWLIHPAGSSLAAIFFSGLEGLVASIAFYTLVAWGVLRWMQQRKRAKKSLRQS
jgi:hypothetical protein